MAQPESYEQEKWYVLKKLQDCFIRTPKHELAEYSILITDPRSQSNKPSPDNEVKLIRQLIGDQVISEIQPSLERKGRVGEYIPYPRYIYFLESSPTFEKTYSKYKKLYENNIVKPTCISKGEWGYLQFQEGKGMTKIAKKTTRSYRLISFLIEPFGVARRTETIFDFITEYSKDTSEKAVDPYLKKEYMIGIIRNTIKELQKNKKMKSTEAELKFKYIKSKDTFCLMYKY